MSIVHPVIMEHYMQMTETELQTMFHPYLRILSKRFPLEIALCICLIRTPQEHPSPGFSVDTISKCDRCRVCIVEPKCMYRKACPRNGESCVQAIRSKTPYFPMEFMEVSNVGNADGVGIGFTTDVRLRDGIQASSKETGGIAQVLFTDRLQQQGQNHQNNDEGGKLYGGNAVYYSHTDDDASRPEHDAVPNNQRRTNVSSMIQKLPDSVQTNLGLAIDYDSNQILLKWPFRRGFVRLDLPSFLHKKLLFPIVQQGIEGASDSATVRFVKMSHVQADGREEIPVEYYKANLSARSLASNSSAGKHDSHADSARVMFHNQQKVIDCNYHGSWSDMICYECGVKVYEKKFGNWMVPIHNYEVHEGICIACNQNDMPTSVILAWKEYRKQKQY